MFLRDGTIVSVNVGKPREVDYGGRRVTSSIWKSPVSGPVAFAGVNLDGDDQADRAVHGGPDKAIGQRLQVGTGTLEVSQPRAPCWKLGMKMEDPAFPKRFTHGQRPGAYLRIIKEGSLAAEDALDVLEPPRHDVTVGDVFRIFSRDRGEAERLLSVPELSQDWKDWASEQIGR
jgi:MOSC domain-containing protein YiiM